MHQFLFNYLFSGLILLCVRLSLTASSFFLVWVFVEATVFFTIPLLAFNTKHETLNTESVIIYFVYQAVARVLIIAGFLSTIREGWSGLIMLGIIVKLGIFPFHVWVVPVLRGCSSWMFLALLVPVKFPIYILSYQWFIDLGFFIIIRVVIGILLARNQTQVLRLVAARRISSTGILIFSINSDVFFWYFLMYSVRLVRLVLGLNNKDNVYVGIRLFSLLGLPMLPIFLPKILLIWHCLEYSWLLGSFLLGRFIISAVYYVKFIPNRMSSLVYSNWGKILLLNVLSFRPLL